MCAAAFARGLTSEEGAALSKTVQLLNANTGEPTLPDVVEVLLGRTEHGCELRRRVAPELASTPDRLAEASRDAALALLRLCEGDLQGMFDGLYPKGMQWYWRGDFVKALPDAAIEAHLEQSAKAPSELSLMHLYPIDGAVHRVGSGETAWNCRDATWSMVIAGIDPNPQKAGPITRWTKAYWEAVHPSIWAAPTRTL